MNLRKFTLFAIFVFRLKEMGLDHSRAGGVGKGGVQCGGGVGQRRGVSNCRGSHGGPYNGGAGGVSQGGGSDSMAGIGHGWGSNHSASQVAGGGGSDGQNGSEDELQR